MQPSAIIGEPIELLSKLSPFFKDQYITASSAFSGVLYDTAALFSEFPLKLLQSAAEAFAAVIVQSIIAEIKYEKIFL